MRPLLLATLLLLAAPMARAQAPVTSERASFRVTQFATGLERPWGGAFLPDGRLLVTERPGRLRLIGRDGRVSPPLRGVPTVEAEGQGGLLDLALAPDFATTREVYLCYAALVRDGGQTGAATRLARARLAPEADALEAVTPLLDATPPQARGRNHFGCRIAFGRDGALFLSTGDRFVTKLRAQRLDDLAGKILRVSRNGAALADNPFAGRPGVRPEIFSYGHRNPQGLAFSPWTGSLWEAGIRRPRRRRGEPDPPGRQLRLAGGDAWRGL
ncbi:PQQ-dependent sugar dehydrogenase [Siccirubricoccus sp. G192]|uniref:PQQ-dependent sugar dehydrogenase n=1 Tax=Siccirubricoccus sp. G192 TaxID=2849651 RepID=UPI0020C279A5|nr:PQQ-dependent sugar dehydrogenase [Siccirubricoccus sp. G192]